MKKIIISMVLVFVVILSMSVFADGIYDVSIELQIGQNQAIVNGKVLKIDENEKVVPFIENGRTLVPIRFVADNLELDVEWVAETQKVILSNTGIKIVLSIGNDEATVNGNRYELDCCPMIKHDRTFVPVRFISETMQCNVSWDEASEKVTIQREKEYELDINAPEVQKLFQDILSQNEFASYYCGYVDNSVLDNTDNMFGGTMRELFSLLNFKELEENTYTKTEAEKAILEFLSKGDTSQSVSGYGIDNLRIWLEQGADFGSESNKEMLVAVYDKTALDDISVDLFGDELPEHESLAYNIGYHSFHLFNRVNLFYPYSKTNSYNVYYNEAGEQYLFTKYLENYGNAGYIEELKSETTLVKATEHNGKISLYIKHQAEFDEYSGGKSTYSGIYKNTYQKGDNGYYWVSSYGMDE